MADQEKCGCARCRSRGLLAPILLITIGVLFLIGQYSHHYTFAELWPIILIVIGAVKLFESAASSEGHIGS